MAKKSVKIWFVIWPDGKMFEGTQTSVSEARAVGNAVRSLLIPQFFPDLDMGHLGYGVLRDLWSSMQRAGFKCHCVDTEADGISA